jgi:hypothetical protein
VSPLHRQLHRSRRRRDGARDPRPVERCQQGVAERFGVRLREEIVYLGEFD